MSRFAPLLVLGALLSLFWFPWPLSALLALCAAPLVPVVPFALGIIADALYYTPGAHALPLFTLLGALATLAALFVRARLAARMMP